MQPKYRCHLTLGRQKTVDMTRVKRQASQIYVISRQAHAIRQESPRCEFELHCRNAAVDTCSDTHDGYYLTTLTIDQHQVHCWLNFHDQCQHSSHYLSKATVLLPFGTSLHTAGCVDRTKTDTNIKQTIVLNCHQESSAWFTDHNE